MGFLPSEIARLVLGYLEYENCKDAYNVFLSSSPNLNECRGRNFTHHLMGYTLVDILDEFGAIQLLLKNCKSTSLRTKLQKCCSNIDKITFLMESADCLKPGDCRETTKMKIADKSTNTQIECRDGSCQTLCDENGNLKRFKTEVVNVTQNGMLPEQQCVKRDDEVEVEENPIIVANLQTESLENNFIDMLAPGTIVSTENISQVPYEVVYFDAASQRNETKRPEQREIESDESGYSLNVYPSDSESETKYPSNLRLEFKCNMCFKICEMKEDLEDHISSTHSLRSEAKTTNAESYIETLHAKETGDIYICDLCKKIFKKRRYLTKHLRYTHEQNWKKCTKCSAEFPKRYQLYRHTKTHRLTNISERKCEQCNRTFSLKYFRIHMTEVHSAHEERFRCEHCSRMYPTQLRLRRHIRHMHTDIGEYQCEFCSQIYESKLQLSRHKRYSHSKDGSLVKCHYCQKTFGSVKQLTRHMREVHQNVPLTFCCQFCSKHYSLKQDLVKHCFSEHSGSMGEAIQTNSMLQRTGSVLMKCSQCDKAFKSERQLENHCKKCRKDGVKCKVCSKTFATNFRMQTHMTRSHSVNGETFICVKCTKVFETKHQLTAHTVMVHGEKKFCCEICSKAFSLKRTLTRHENQVHYKRGK